MTISAIAAAILVALTAAAAPTGAMADGRFGFRTAASFVSPARSVRQLAQRRYYERQPNRQRFRFTPRRLNNERFSPRGYRYNRQPAARGRLPMQVVAARALACHPGRILDARLQGSTYVFKILTRRGRLVRVYGDARTGAVSCR